MISALCWLSANININNYLVAFAYHPEAEGSKGHVVIGAPQIYDSDKMRVSLIIAVRIESIGA